MKLEGHKAKEYMDTYFDKTWSHFDVNQTGMVEVERMPGFMRFLCSDQTMELD